MAIHKEPIKNPFFSKVREATEAIMERAMEVFELHMENARAAMANKDHETANKATSFLIEHMPNEDGVTMVDISVDKPKQVDQNRIGPSINIGFKIGGIEKPKELPAVNVIDVEKEDE
jgi:hypothetical protein